ncbi:MAG TPA: peptidylprolyl isomerase [Polyangiales bacterium]|nr:peptidylprolyl isomerase [Polyangiales bacterium]
MPIRAQQVVSIEYTLKDDEGRTLDTSEGRPPLAYMHGAGNIVAGLEKALDGKDVGDVLDVKVSPEEGYGTYVSGLVRNIPVRKLPDGRGQVGMRFHLRGAEGGPRVFTVTQIKGDYARVDGNHPLAGKTLHFHVKVVDVRDPSAEELAHGHVHGPGGHDH